MNKLLMLIVFVLVAGVLWWALGEVLAVLALPVIFNTLAKVAFVLILVFAGVDYFMNGRWFWNRP